ncbi:MAG: polynucleotide adenylyltransferase PcnB [Myxococcota bacterium]
MPDITEKEREIKLHKISNEKIDPDAVNIVKRLRSFNYRAYICGGGVRDLLLGIIPKDFDVATDAHPKRLRKIFRNSRVIGRRFQLVHVLFPKNKVIEVATFRRQNQFAEESAACYIARDNTFGTPREDARRRDFTINGLFYDIEREEVIDYVGGMEDLKRGIISSIGDPYIRFKEDPVRMVRAVRFAAKLDMSLAKMCAEAISECKNELYKCSTSRLAEETLRLLRQGHSEKSFQLLRQLGLMEILLPNIETLLKEQRGKKTEEIFWRRFALLDAYAKNNSAPTDSIMVAALFAPFLDTLPHSQNGLDHLAPEIILQKINEIPITAALPRSIKGRVMEIVSAYRSLSKPNANTERILKRLKKRKYYPESFAFWRIDALARNEQNETGVLPPPLAEKIAQAFADIPPASERPSRRRKPR